MKKVLFVLASLFLAVTSVQAKGADAIYAWVDGESTCYQLSQMPRVEYEGNEAILIVDNQEKLRLELTENSHLVVTFGEYVPNGLEDVEESATVKKVGKYIYGGRVLIERDGVWYDVYGKIIK